jgi:hypothetical protein
LKTTQQNIFFGDKINNLEQDNSLFVFSPDTPNTSQSNIAFANFINNLNQTIKYDSSSCVPTSWGQYNIVVAKNIDTLTQNGHTYTNPKGSIITNIGAFIIVSNVKKTLTSKIYSLVARNNMPIEQSNIVVAGKINNVEQNIIPNANTTAPLDNQTIPTSNDGSNQANVLVSNCNLNTDNVNTSNSISSAVALSDDK